MRLRARQEEAVEASLEALREHGNTLLVAPTGAGKTVMLSATTARWVLNLDEGPLKALVIQHRDELTDQNLSKFRKVSPTTPVSVFDSKSKSFNGRVTFGMVPSLARNLDLLEPMAMLTVDEAHHVPTKSYQSIIDRLRELNPNMVILGVTATPNRGDGKGLLGTFNNVSDEITIGEQIASGHLVPPRTFVVDVGAQGALAGVRRLAQDFDMKAVEAIMDKKIVTDRVIQIWLNGDPDRGLPSCRGRKTIGFCSTVEHAQHVAEQFNAAGVKAVWMSGEDPAGRREAQREFEQGDAEVMLNVAIATEGYDYQPIACVLLLRPSSYKSTMTQMIGRGLRIIDEELFPGVTKTDCVILDFGTASLTHGTLEEEARLEGRKKGKGPKKTCPECDSRVPISTMECPFCGHIWDRPEHGPKLELAEFVMTEVDLLAKSDHRWINIWSDDSALMAADPAAWAGIFLYAGLWHTVAGNKSELRHLGKGERIVALALADDWLNEHAEATPSKIRKWARTPATERQRSLLKLPPFDPMTLYEAMARITFKFNRDAIQDRVLEN